MNVDVAVLGLPVPNSPYGFCGCKAIFEEEEEQEQGEQEQVHAQCLGAV